MKCRWVVAPAQPLLVAKLAAELNLSPLLAQCLLNRGFSEPDAILRFLEPRLKHLADPFLLPNMAAAVDRLFTARERSEALVIFGDYDVDGVTSTALLTQVLRELGWQVDYYLPHRMEEGYGLSQDGVENCLAKFPTKLLLAVDCGSTAVASIAWLKERGVDVIVLDHHQVSTPAPDAVALVNPQLSRVPEVLGLESAQLDAGLKTQDSRLKTRDYRELCSVGLAFKLAHALVKRGRELGLAAARDFDVRTFLDLVALGTIADLVPLTDENRILVTAGLVRLNKTHRPGLIALKKVAAINKPIGVQEVGFQLGPRLNAAGRLENAENALHLLIEDNATTAERIAHELDTHNRERQNIERGIADTVIGAVRARFNAETDYVIVEGQLLWHIGVVGIVASRALREFYRPTLILGGDGEHWRGSGRSIEGFDLASALRECDDLLLRHGGHAMAAGISIHPDKVDAFRSRLNEIARRTLKPDQLQPTLQLDSEVTLGELTVERLRELERLQPVGQGNRGVQFLSRTLAHQRPPQRMGKQQQHAKLWVTDGTATREAVLWGAAKSPLPEGKFDIAFAPQLNEFNGRTTVQLRLLDWRPCPKS